MVSSQLFSLIGLSFSLSLRVYIGLKGTAEELGLPRTNFWIHPHNDYDAAVERFMQDTLTCGVTGAMMAGLLTTIAMVAMRKMTPLMKRIYS